MSMYRMRLSIWITCAALMAACSNQRESAQESITEIEMFATAASPEAAKYIPDQLDRVRNRLDQLRASLDKGDYSSVESAAPALLNEARALSGAAAAKKAELIKALNEQWSALAGALPAHATAVQNRIDWLSQKSSRKLVAEIDIDAARTRLSAARALWSKAQAAFATGNLDEAVATANKLKTEIDGLAVTLNMDLPTQKARVPSLTMTAAPPI